MYINVDITLGFRIYITNCIFFHKNDNSQFKYIYI